MSATAPRDDTKVFRYSWKPALTIVGVAFALNVAIVVLSQRFSLIGFAVIMGLSAVFASYFAYLALRVKLVIDASGVTFVERDNSVSMAWENIHSVACGTVPGQKELREYTLFSHGTPVISFQNEIGDSERAYRTIERRISVDLYPRYREALDRGDTVRFGVVNLSRYSLNVRHVTLPVNEARFVRDGTALVLVRRGSNEVVISVDEREVENINILLRCATEIDPLLVTAVRAA